MQNTTKQRWIVMVVFALILMMAPWGGISPERAIVIVLAINFIVVPKIKGQFKFGYQEQAAEVPQQQPTQRRRRASSNVQPKLEFRLKD